MSSKFIDIVFDGPPAPESGRFVEVEDDQQRGISVGDWIEDGDFWRLRISEPYKRIVELEAELAWYRTLKIVRQPHNITEIDGGKKAQMLHEMWEENVRLKKELSERGLSPKETEDLFGGKFLNTAQQSIELLNRANKIESLEHELEETRKAFRYELNEVKCADETIVDLETARNRLCEAIIEEYKTKGAFEKVYDMATEILGDD